MILNKKIKIKIIPNNYKHYQKLGYNISLGNQIEIPINHLSIGSNHIIDVKCDVCGKIGKKSYKHYMRSYNNGGYYSCSKKCSDEKIKNTNLDRYGVDYYFKSIDFKEKGKKTNLEKYGVDHYSKTKEFLEKTKKTNLEKYGVENSMFSDILKERLKNTNLDRYGVENWVQINQNRNLLKDRLFSNGMINPMYHQEYLNKRKETFLNKYGVDHYKQSEEYKEKCILEFNKINDTKLINFSNGVSTISCQNGHIANILTHNLNYRLKNSISLCPICTPTQTKKSLKEIHLGNAIKDFGVNVIENYIIPNSRLEIDIYIPEMMLGIEFNGLYWHSDIFKEKNYHINKQKIAKQNNIELIYIWEDDWDNKKDIILSMLKNRLNKIKDKIYARQCIIKHIDSNESKNFLNKNHIQGNCVSKNRIGLYFNNELVSIMTFGDRSINSNNCHELLRFCNKINTNVIGGASKLFKYYLKITTSKTIISFADKSFFSGGLYEKLNFKYTGDTAINYWWCLNNKRYHRFNFNKKRLINMGFDPNKTEYDIMTQDLNSYKIWGSGMKKYVFNFV